MAKRNALSIDLTFEGLDEFIDQLDDAAKHLEHNMVSAMKEYESLVDEGTRSLTPRDEGDLENSITVDIPKLVGNTVVGGISSNLAYALRRHEEPYRRGVHDKYDNGTKYEDYYVDGRGRRTLQKPAWRGQRPGRKYMARAVELTERDYDEIFAQALEDTLRGRRR